MQWIKVEDELPSYNKLSGYVYDGRHTRLDVWFNHNKKIWEEEKRFDYPRVVIITHWMPRPLPPIQVSDTVKHIVKEVMNPIEDFEWGDIKNEFQIDASIMSRAIQSFKHMGTITVIFMMYKYKVSANAATSMCSEIERRFPDLWRNRLKNFTKLNKKRYLIDKQ